MTRAMARTMMRAAAYNNQPQPRTHLPRKTALHRPSFLIECPELETDLTCTKQTADPMSNRQFFALLELPDTFPAGSFRDDHFPRPAPRKTQQAAQNRRSLIGNDMHSPDSATAAKCAISIFLIGNEFRLWRVSQENPHAHKSSMGHPENTQRLAAPGAGAASSAPTKPSGYDTQGQRLRQRRVAQVKRTERSDRTLVATGTHELACFGRVPLD